jgi:hypothetical protein
MGRRLAFALFIAMAGLSGCAPAADDAAGEDVAELSTSRRQQALAAIDAAINELDRTIDRLEREIAALETTNADKLARVDSLVAAIEARKREIEENQRRKEQNALLFCMIGACNVGAVSLAMAIQDDSRIQQLNAELAQARAEQSAAAAKLALYREQKTKTTKLLDELRDRETALRQVYGSSAPTPRVKDPRPSSASRSSRGSRKETAPHASSSAISRTRSERWRSFAIRPPT